MSDLISRSALIERIVNTPTEESGYNPVYLNGCATRQKEIIDIINELPLVEPVRGEWIDVKDALPPEKEHWKEYIVCVERSHYPTSTYDIIDSPYSETIITTAKYDSQQKIWHLQWDEQLNALMDIDDSPLNGEYITHWMPLPEPYDMRKKVTE